MSSAKTKVATRKPPQVVAAHPVSEDWCAVYAGEDGPQFSRVISVAYVQDGDSISPIAVVGGRGGLKPAHLVEGFLGITDDVDDDVWEDASDSYHGGDDDEEPEED